MAERIVSPGVFTEERDLSFLPQGISDIGAAIIGPTEKGPAFTPTILSNFQEFESTFGKVTEDYYVPYTVQEYLKSASSVTIVRVLGIGGYKTDYVNIVTSVGTDTVAAAATATITISDYTELNAGDIVNLVATDGTNYDFEQGSQSSVNGTFEATTSNNATATNLMNVINTSSGPAGTRFTAAVSSAVVTVTQATAGGNGNTTITLTDSGTAGMTKTDFTGGAAT